MSVQMLPKPTATDVCDICGKEIDTYTNRDRCALNWGTTPIASMADPKPRHFLFFRKGHGNRTSGAPKGDYENWRWDFHGECLVDLMRQHISTRPPNDS